MDANRGIIEWFGDLLHLPGTAVGTCRRCGHPMVMFAEKWIHDVGRPSLSGTIGCRAASFDRLGTWDDSIPRQWYGSVDKDSIRYL